jgi:hypothetical protein
MPLHLIAVGDQTIQGSLSTNSGSSDQWSSTYTTVQANSASWGAGGGGSDVTGLSANWENTYNTVRSLSSGWGGGGGGSDVTSLSADWENTFTLVNTLSTDWQNTFTTVKNLSSGWSGGSVDNASVNAAISTNLSATRAALKILLITPSVYASLSASYDPETIYIVTE